MVDDGTMQGQGDDRTLRTPGPADRTVPTPPPPPPSPPPQPPAPPPPAPPERAEVADAPPTGSDSTGSDSTDAHPDDAGPEDLDDGPSAGPAGPVGSSRSIGPVRAGEGNGRRSPSRQTWTFAGLLAGVVLLGLLAFAVFQGALTLPFGGGTAPTPTVCAAPSAAVQSARLTRVRVLNASDRRGLALATARELQKRGFTIPEPPGNDAKGAAVSSAAVVRHGPTGARAARTVATQVKGKVTDEQDDRLGEVVDLVLGQTFALLDPAAGVAALKTRPAPSPLCASPSR